MTYTDVFGSATLPPSEYGYASFTLTTNATFVWPYNTDGSSYPVAKVMDIACDAGNEITLPDCTEVSTGEDFLIRNVGANVLIVKDAAGVQVASVAVGAASYFYLTENTTAAGVFGVIGFGVGTSTADASSLVGYGIKAVGASLNQAHPVQPTNTGITLSTDHRAKLVVFTGGVATFTLDSAATLGDDYFTMFRNDGTGTATIDPAASELIDGMTSMQVQPGESLMLICTGTKWYTVGYGRSTLYQFTQLTKDVSAGGTITLSATEAANKLITFIGNPSAAVEVVVPAVVAVYYTQSAISTAQTITLKTSAGSGVGINQGTRVIALCDGTNVVSAQSAVANTSVSLTDGSAFVPSLFFATQTNTGLFKSGTQGVGVSVGGSAVAVFGSTGLQTNTIGPNSTQRHTLPAVPSDTVTLNTATQALTNKTIGVDSNTISGLAASSFVLSNASGNIDGSAAQKVIPTGVVVGTTDTQTLTNKTFSLASNTLTGTLAQFNTALSDADFATLAGFETLTNKSISGSTNTLSNIANAALTNSSVTINGTPVALGGTVTITASDVGYLPSGTGAVATNVQAKLREFVSVKDFGAVGDGATDDTTSVQNAIDYISGVGGILYFPPGTYNVTDRLFRASSTKPFYIKGAGENLTFIKRASNFNASVMEFRNSHNILIEDLTVDANNSVYSNGNHSLVIYDSDYPKINRVTVTNFKNSGILVYSLAGTRKGARINNCSAFGMNVAPVGILISGMKDSGMHGCSAYDITNVVHGSDGYGLELKNECDGCFITDAYANNCTVAVAFGEDIGTVAVKNSRVSVTSIACNFAFVSGRAENNHIDVIAEAAGAVAGEQVIDIQSNSIGNTVRVTTKDVTAAKRVVRIRAGCTDNVVNVDCIASLPANSVIALFDLGSERNTVNLSRVGGTSMPTAGYAGLVMDNSTANNNVFNYALYPRYESATIAAGVIQIKDPSSESVLIDTEGAAATDDLTTINGPTFEGKVLTLRTTANARDVIVKHATGNIRLNGVADFTLDGVADTLTLRYNSTLSMWCEIARSNNV